MYSLHDIEVNGLDLAEVLECEIESGQESIVRW